MIGICSEYKITNIEQIKLSFFELVERYENRILLERENNKLLQLSNLLQNQIETKRQSLHCQNIVGHILKNLFDSGIKENDIVNIKAIVDILLYNSEDNIKKLNEQKMIIKDLSNYSNLKLSIANLILEFNAILSTQNREKIQKHIDSINKIYSSLYIYRLAGNIFGYG